MTTSRVASALTNVCFTVLSRTACRRKNQNWRIGTEQLKKLKGENSNSFALIVLQKQLVLVDGLWQVTMQFCRWYLFWIDANHIFFF